MKALGFCVTDSRSNFLFATHETISAAELYGKLREQGILVRHFGLPRIENHLRISVGTDEEMDALVRALKQIISR